MAVPLWLICFYLTMYFLWLILYKGMIKKTLNRLQLRRICVHVVISFIPTFIGAGLHILKPFF